MNVIASERVAVFIRFILPARGRFLRVPSFRVSKIKIGSVLVAVVECANEVASRTAKIHKVRAYSRPRIRATGRGYRRNVSAGAARRSHARSFRSE